MLVFSKLKKVILISVSIISFIFLPCQEVITSKSIFSYEFYGAISSYEELKDSPGKIDNDESKLMMVRVSNNYFTFDVGNGSDFEEDKHFIAKNVPSGLNIKITKIYSVAKISFEGTAISHTASDSIKNISVEWLAASLQKETQLSNNIKKDIAITFKD